MKANREYRNMEMRANTDEESMVVEGYATTFMEPYVLFDDGEYRVMEQVASDAFEGCDMSDVIMQYDHQGRVFARNKNNTLELNPDEKGLMVRADLSGTDIGRQLYGEIKGGYTDKMSFGFTVKADTWEEKNEGNQTFVTRTIDKIGKLYDVSAVSIPANDGTSINATDVSVRNLTDGVIEKIKAERLEREISTRRKKLEIRTRLLMEEIHND